MQELREAGYLPAAVRNYLALLGWGTDDDTTMLSTEELVERFSIERRRPRRRRSSTSSKLRWMNGRYMRELPLDEYAEAAAAQLERAGHAEAAADASAGAPACAIAQDKAQTLEEVWPPDRLPVRADPVDDAKAWAKVMERDGVGDAPGGGGSRRCGAVEPFDADARSRRELGDRGRAPEA